MEFPNFLELWFHDATVMGRACSPEPALIVWPPEGSNVVNVKAVALNLQVIRLALPELLQNKKLFSIKSLVRNITEFYRICDKVTWEPDHSCCYGFNFLRI